MWTHRVLKAKRNKLKLRFHLKHLLTLIIILTFIISIFFSNCISYQNALKKDNNLNLDNLTPPLNAGVDPEILIPPYLKNITDICNFFQINYESVYSDMLYYRRGDNAGNIIDYSVYSIDNILFYKTIAKQLETLNGAEILNYYTQSQLTNLWYYLNNTVYGFVNSINGTTGEIIDSNRYLIDNIMPIFLLIDNYYSGSYSKIINMFDLIKRSEFWDFTNIGFLHSNSSLTSHKYAIDNLYAILANMLIARSPQFNVTTRNTALDLANQTMIKMVENLWDFTQMGFDREAGSDWSSLGPPYDQKRIDINALGIMALLDFYVQTNDSLYLNNATLIFNKANLRLWNPVYQLYHAFTPDHNWNSPASSNYVLKDNALMMKACLKLFEITGNQTYYERAYQIFEGVERNLYDSSNKAYGYLVYNGGTIDNNKNITSNIYLIDAYLEATEIFNSPQVVASYNVTDPVPDYIFNQDLLNITTSYTYQSFMNTTYIYDVNITYVFNYPNGTRFDEETGYINQGDKSHTLIYNITDALPYGNGYKILIWANSSMFCYNQTIKKFNVMSGLVNKPIEGLGLTLYQGPTINITIPVNNTRNGNVTLDVSMESDNIENDSLSDVKFTSYLYANDTFVSFNLTTKINAELGPDNIIFRFTKGSVLYLLINASIIIGYSFDYTALIYDDEVVNEDLVEIKFNLINFLPSTKQPINVSFSGDFLNNSGYFMEQVNLTGGESKPLMYNLKVSGTGNISIVMNLSRSNVVYYTETLSISIVPSLELIRTSYPQIGTQWDYLHLIIMIKNNKKEVEPYTLSIIEQNPIFGFPSRVIITNQLAPGINRIEAQIYTTLNPYETGIKTYRYELRNSNGEIIDSDFFEVNLQLSTSALFFCYIIPIAIPIIIILIYINKNLKNRMLRRR